MEDVSTVTQQDRVLVRRKIVKSLLFGFLPPILILLLAALIPSKPGEEVGWGILLWMIGIITVPVGLISAAYHYEKHRAKVKKTKTGIGTLIVVLLVGLFIMYLLGYFN